MLDMLKYNDIILHLNTISSIYKLNPRQDWIQILCPYCDDSTRHGHIDHGHFYIARHFNYCHCFRCDTKISIKQFLKHTGFGNFELLNSIFKTNSNYSYTSEPKTPDNLQKKIILSNFDPDKLLKFEKYVESRLLNIDYDKFKIYPSYDSNSCTLYCNFNNYYNEFSAARVIESKKINFRYLKKDNSKFYFFQNPFEFESITICEGPFDIINLYNFSNKFNNNCFFSINGKSYVNSAIKIISDYYLTNLKLRINVVVDSDISYTNILKKNFIQKTNVINNNITVKFYKPMCSKDVSDIVLFKEI